MSKRLPLLTNSSLTTFRRCPREYFYAYVLLRRGIHKPDALRFGSIFHLGLNAWWSINSSQDAKLGAALRAVHEGSESFDAFDIIKAKCLLVGYTARWGNEGYETIAVEKNFRMPIDDGTPDPEVYDLGGSIDAIVRDVTEVDYYGPQIIHNVEHKTTSLDISEGADYWRNIVALDPQVSTYEAASKAMGYDVRDTIYDVIRKPELTPWKATPEDAKKYTKPTKSEPIPRLYSNQRETDETPEEYRARLTDDIIRRPDWYFARKTIVRLERDVEEHARDVVQTAAMIQFAERRGAWPRSPNACVRWHRLCPYHPVCEGSATIDDGTRFESKSRQHEELDGKGT